MQQHSEEWIKARLGKATASRAEHWMATLRTGGVPAVRKQYLAELVLERLTGTPFPSYQSAAMLAGTELEPEARAAYAFWANVDVLETGFVPHPRIDMAGASPDGLIGDDGLVEIKCPLPATHMDTLLRPHFIERGYIYQMMFQMACTGRLWCDFVSYGTIRDDQGNNLWPEPMRLCVARVPRDDILVDLIEKEVQRFLAEVDATIEALCETYEMPERAPRALSEPLLSPRPATTTMIDEAAREMTRGHA
jgi:YqaJ-like viral recombinase domain